MERLGLIGLPNSGKSSLYNALTGGSAVVAQHPFSTTETLSGVAIVPDKRLDALSAMSKSKKTVYAHVEFVDIAGLVAGANSGEGLGNRFLAGIREVDALCMVLRAFQDENVPGESDPLEALGILELELVLADLAACETLVERRRKSARADKSLQPEVDALEKAIEVLTDGTPIYKSSLSVEVKEVLKGSFLLTNKAVLIVVNLGEDQLENSGEICNQVRAAAGGSIDVLGVCVQLESESMALEAGEREELLAGLGLGEGALPRVAQAAYHMLDRRTFLTTGDKESRAWTFRAGAKAPECAGVIHSDLQRGFIRAEVIHWDELLALGSWNTAKNQGKLGVEGKDYEVKDGDVLEIRFNV
ncbi:MAG: redox-regulated ATPase YchF [Acidimicrobiaceae bacterium]|nr:redox-regulated ATPase YchF [Acidimicrobiaceae bacterium]